MKDRPPERSEPVRKVSEQRRRLFSALNDFIHSQGGWLVSHLGERELRVQVPRKSPLPSKLIELGYSDVRAAGVSTRATSSGLLPVDLITFTLPVK